MWARVVGMDVLTPVAMIGGDSWTQNLEIEDTGTFTPINRRSGDDAPFWLNPPFQVEPCPSS